ncbi:MAG: YciI family protein [Enterobacterales bacterium]|nr:YciI family protein [Enterobacterales bacterium]
MYYAIYAIINPQKLDVLKLREASRPAHLARLEELNQQQRLLIAGPHPVADSQTPDAQGFNGSLIVAEFESLSEAQNWTDQDPYLLAGVYEEVSVKPFIKVLP